MTTDLATVAKIAQDAARREVLTAMEAHDRYNPAWEVQEVGIHYAIRNGLLAHFGAMPEPRPRVAGEYGANAMGNMNFAPFVDSHPADLVVLHPLVQSTAPNTYSGYAWAAENSAVLGLIEVKKDWRAAKSDVIWLDKVSALATRPGMRELDWVLLVVFLAGKTRDAVAQLGENIGSALASWRFQPLTVSDPIEAHYHPGSADVPDRWFDVMCYGKPCLRGA